MVISNMTSVLHAIILNGTCHLKNMQFHVSHMQQGCLSSHGTREGVKYGPRNNLGLIVIMALCHI